MEVAASQYILTPYTRAQSHPTSQRSPRASSCYFPIKYQMLHFILPSNIHFHASYFYPSASCHASLTLLLVCMSPLLTGSKRVLHDQSRSLTLMTEAEFPCSINTYTISPKCHCTKTILTFQEYATLFTNQCFLGDATF